MIRVLFVAGNVSDAKLALSMIGGAAGSEAEVIHVERLSTALRYLGQEAFDAILLDLDLIDTDGLETVIEIHAAFAGLPIILLVRREDELLALQAIRHGAQDSVFKETYTGHTVWEAIRKALARKYAEKGLGYLAQYDGLTDLANRTLFKDRAAQALARKRRHDLDIALMRVGLDQFKRVNDALGYENGDLILKTAACRLQGCVREVDTVARLWGDEFAVLLEGLSGEVDVEVIAGRILESMSETFEVGGVQAGLTASIGLARFPEHGQQMDVLLKSAGYAMARAKGEGGHRYLFHVPARG